MGDYRGGYHYGMVWRVMVVMPDLSDLEKIFDNYLLLFCA